MMSECKTDEIINHGNYYSYRGQLYIKQFPKMWATSHVPETGPEECNNCSYHGSWNGIFIGYCVNCAEYIYEFQRGHGFIDHGEEQDLDIPQLGAMDTYLKGVDLDKCGRAIPDEFYYISSDDEDEHILDKMKEFRKYNKQGDDYYVRTTPVSDNSCDICAIGK
jgi:hypothetical protein